MRTSLFFEPEKYTWIFVVLNEFVFSVKTARDACWKVLITFMSIANHSYCDRGISYESWIFFC